jgi:hypothetical protein
MTAESTLVLLIRHGETPTTGKVLPGHAPGLHLSERGTHLDLFKRIMISPGSVPAIGYAEGEAPAVLMVNSTSEPPCGLRVP